MPETPFPAEPATMGRNGYTLLEVLVALAIAGVVLSLLGQTLLFSIREWEREQEDDADGLQAAMRLMAAQVLSYERVAQAGDAADVFSLQGTETDISFATHQSLHALHGGGPVFVRYAFRQVNGQGRLYYAEYPLDIDDPQAARAFLQWQPGIPPDKGVHVVQTPAQEFRLSYERTHGRGRFDQWPYAAELPLAVMCQYRGRQEERPLQVMLFPESLAFSPENVPVGNAKGLGR